MATRSVTCCCTAAIAAALLSPAALEGQGSSAPAPSPFRAATAPDTAETPRDTTARVAFDIPEQPLGDALGDYARQAGVRIVADGAALRGVKAHEVEGRMTAREAIRLLLEGTGFSFRFPDPTTVVVAKGELPAAQQLAAVVVTGTAVREQGYTANRTFSATKTDTPLRDTPQSVTVVTHELIDDQAMRGMTEVVRYVPGVTMGQGEGHRDAPTIRGNSTTADFYVDGVRDDVQYIRDLYNVDRVEALKGSNAMIFGRGGGGGVINRVSKEAQWAPVRSLSLTGGSHEHKRGAIDIGQGLGRLVAFRVNGMLEQSGGYRSDAFELDRFGVNPTAAIALGARTNARIGYEFFSDDRTVDRGIPSFNGRPSDAPVDRYFGDPAQSYVDATVHSASALLEHSTARGLIIRNRTRFAHYDRFYQNVYASSAVDAQDRVRLGAYNNSMIRDNVFNQTDVTLGVGTGGIWHTLLVGAEIGRQGTDNFRNTGYFGNTNDPYYVPFASPTVSTPITFRQSASDADNRVVANVASVYAQDQVALGAKLQAIVGVRLERFALDFRNNRDGEELARTDEMVSPRLGLILKPREEMSFYGSYSVSFLPGSGDQFSSMNATTQTLEPERFTNYELGAKWDVRPSLSLTAAAYRLDRTNTRATDPSDPTRTVQTGEQRTSGWEVGVTGRPTSRWEVAGGFASQTARIESATTAAPAGRTVPLVPHSTFSLWNKLDATERVSGGLGVVYQGKSYTSIDNTVTLPAFTRVDAGLFVRLTGTTRAQLNVENLLDTEYFPTSHGNNNIQPGAPRTFRLSVVTGF